MKRAFHVLLIVSACALAQGQTANTQRQAYGARQVFRSGQHEAGGELNSAASEFSKGNFAEAERHVRKALELDPNNARARFALARILHAQYKLGVNTDENIAKARAAIEAYKVVLQGELYNEEAYISIAALYGSIGERELRRQWILKRALDEDAPAKKRAEAYIVLASFDWSCSYEITEEEGVRQKIIEPNGQTGFRYAMPADRNLYDRAKQCQVSGMEMIENAIRLDPENPRAWAYKGNLLVEMAKAAEMEDNGRLKADLMKQADEALKRTDELNKTAMREENETRVDTDEYPWAATRMNLTGLAAPIPIPQEDGDSTEPTVPVISGGVLNGKAIRLPAPEYPDAARPSHVSGMVVVKVMVDERGNVISAQAISGNPLLHAAAIKAARQAKFAPTKLSGQPVKVTGTLIYNFISR